MSTDILREGAERDNKVKKATRAYTDILSAQISKHVTTIKLFLKKKQKRAQN